MAWHLNFCVYHDRRVLCPNCLKDCTISVAKLKKAYNIVDYEQLALLEDLPFTQNYHRCVSFYVCTPSKTLNRYLTQTRAF